jgi:hypothetical protein
VYLTNRENVLDVCYRLAQSIGAYLVPGLDGKFKLVRLTGTPGTSSYTVTGTDMEEGSLSITRKFEVQAAAKVAYCKNWTVQATGLAAGLKAEYAALLSKEWIYSSANNSTLATNYQQSLEPPQKDTLLVTTTNADAEAARIVSLRGQPRYIYTANYLPHMLVAELGDVVTLASQKRYTSLLGANGTAGVVVEINRDWLRGRVSIGVLV